MGPLLEAARFISEARDSLPVPQASPEVRLVTTGVPDTRSPGPTTTTSAIYPDLDPARLEGGIARPGSTTLPLRCAAEGTAAKCVRVLAGPFVLTDVHPAAPCAQKLLIAIVDPNGELGSPRWAVTGIGNAIAMHGARVGVRDGEVLVAGVSSVGMDRDARCSIAWNGFRLSLPAPVRELPIALAPPAALSTRPPATPVAIAPKSFEPVAVLPLPSSAPPAAPAHADAVPAPAPSPPAAIGATVTTEALLSARPPAPAPIASIPSTSQPTASVVAQRVVTAGVPATASTTSPPALVDVDSSSATFPSTSLPSSTPAITVPVPPAPVAQAPIVSAVAPPASTTQASGTSDRSVQHATASIGDSSAPRTPTRSQQAQELVSDGERLLASGKFSLAVERFDAALELRPEARVASASYRGLGNTYEKLGNYRRAAHNFKMYLSFCPTEERPLIKKRIESLDHD